MRSCIDVLPESPQLQLLLNMFVSHILLVCMALLAPAFGQLSTSSTSFCATSYGTRSLRAVPSTTRTKLSTTTATRAILSFPITTKTLKAVTQTIFTDVTIVKTITAPQDTDIFTTTLHFDVTSTSTQTITIPSTKVETTTITEPAGTTTISTSAGFTPIKSVPGNPPNRKREHPHFVDKHRARDVAMGPDMDSLGRGKPNRYPASVSCDKSIKVVTTKIITVKDPRTFTKYAPGPTSLITSSNLHTSETIENPVRASTTITESTTATFSTALVIEETSITTLTEVETTSAAPTATAFPGCGADNILSSRDGHRIEDSTIANQGNFGGNQVLPLESPTACCEACQLNANCGVFQFVPTQSGTQFCYLYITRQCAPEEVFIRYRAPDISRPFGSAFTLGNGNCGRYQWDGYTGGP